MGINSEENGPSKTNRYRVEAVDRALLLLDTLASFPGANASQLAATLGANRSLVFRMLSTLADRGFVVKDKHSCFRLGPRLLYLGQQAEASDALMDASREYLDGLLEATQENVYLIVRDGTEMLCLAARLSAQPVRLAAEVGSEGGLHSGGAAKMLLAYSPPEIIEQVIEKHLQDFVPPRIRSREAVEKVIAKIRSDGYYEGVGEINDETYTMSAPIRDGQQTVIAVLALAAPISRIPEARRPELRRLVLDSANRISQALGGRQQAFPNKPMPG